MRVRVPGLRSHPGVPISSKRVFHEGAGESNSAVYALARSVEERDPCLGRHCERLALMSSAIGVVLNLPGEDILALNRGGYLHDIGKRDLPNTILLKDGPLSKREWELMKMHPVTGEEICKGIPALRAVLPIIRHHHERWDGSGYPDGLKGGQISLLARILQMADIYDALTSERPYKPAFSRTQALEIMEEETAKGWRDPALMTVLKAVSPLFDSDHFWQLSSLSMTALAGAVQSYGLPFPVPQS